MTDLRSSVEVWQKSTRCASNACVEVSLGHIRIRVRINQAKRNKFRVPNAANQGPVRMRDVRNQVLEIRRSSWIGLLSAIKRGELDYV